MKHIMAVALLVSLASCAGLPSYSYDYHRREAVITEVSELPPFGTGTISAWVRLRAKATQGAGVEEYLLPYMTETQQIPRVGATCDIKYYFFTANGFIGERLYTIEHARVVDTISCHGPDAFWSAHPSRPN